MSNRSNINLVGNTTQGQNLGSGAGVFKCKNTNNNLQFKTISATGTSIQIFNCANQIYISGATGGAATYSFSNGITAAGTAVKLGGNLTQNTLISGGSGNRNFKLVGVTGLTLGTIEDSNFPGYYCNSIKMTNTDLSINADAGSANVLISGQDGVKLYGCGNTCLEVGTTTIMCATYIVLDVTGGTAIFMKGLEPNGGATCVVWIGTDGQLYTATPTSDSRLKKNIVPIGSASMFLDKICGYSAEFNELSNCPGCCEYVLLAQEVEVNLPLAVKSGVIINNVDYKKIEYDQLIPVLWNIVKEQGEKIKNLEDRINSL